MLRTGEGTPEVIAQELTRKPRRGDRNTPGIGRFLGCREAPTSPPTELLTWSACLSPPPLSPWSSPPASSPSAKPSKTSFGPFIIPPARPSTPLRASSGQENRTRNDQLPHRRHLYRHGSRPLLRHPRQDHRRLTTEDLATPADATPCLADQARHSSHQASPPLLQPNPNPQLHHGGFAAWVS